MSDATSRTGGWGHTVAAVVTLLVGECLPLPFAQPSNVLPTPVSERLLDLVLHGNFASTPGILNGGLVGTLAVAWVLTSVALPGNSSARGKSIARAIMLIVVIAMSVFETYRSGGFLYAMLERPSAWALTAAVAGGGILWLLALWIDELGIGRGALVLLLAQTVLMLLRTIFVTAEMPALGGPGVLLGTLLAYSPLFVLATLLGFVAPRQWPVTLARGLALTSPLDVLGIEAAALTWSASLARRLLWPFPETWADFGTAALGGVSILLIVNLVRRDGLVRVRAFGWAVLSVMLVGGLVGSFAFAQTETGSSLVRDPPPPVVEQPAPRRTTRVVMLARRAAPEAAQRDAEILIARLARVGIEASVESTDAEHIRLVATDLPELRASVRVLGGRGILLVAPLAEDQAPLLALADRLGPPAYVDRLVHPPRVVMSGRDVIETALNALPPLPFGVETVVACGEMANVLDDPSLQRCSPWLVEASVLAPEAVHNVREVTGAGSPAAVEFVIDEAGVDRLGTLAADRAGERLVIALDGEVLAMPILSPSMNARPLRVAMGNVAVESVVRARVAAIAAALMTERLSTRWTLEPLPTERQLP